MQLITLLTTNAIKVAGLFVGLHGAFGHHPSNSVIALGAFMMAGAQFGEGTLLALLDRFLNPPEHEKPHGS